MLSRCCVPLPAPCLCQVYKSASDGQCSDDVSAASKLATETTGRYPVMACQRRHSQSMTVTAVGQSRNKWLMV